MPLHAPVQSLADCIELAGLWDCGLNLTDGDSYPEKPNNIFLGQILDIGIQDSRQHVKHTCRGSRGYDRPPSGIFGILDRQRLILRPFPYLRCRLDQFVLPLIHGSSPNMSDRLWIPEGPNTDETLVSYFRWLISQDFGISSMHVYSATQYGSEEKAPCSDIEDLEQSQAYMHVFPEKEVC